MNERDFVFCKTHQAGFVVGSKTFNYVESEHQGCNLLVVGKHHAEKQEPLPGLPEPDTGKLELQYSPETRLINVMVHDEFGPLE
jgi:hypothetical protein